MSEQKIAPALSAEEWAYWLRDGERVKRDIASACDAISFGLHQDPAKLLALSNSALPDSDPRKITRKAVTLVRAAADALEHDSQDGLRDGFDGAADANNAAALRVFADALESQLPPPPRASLPLTHEPESL
jgi:hypothetical protein